MPLPNVLGLALVALSTLSSAACSRHAPSISAVQGVPFEQPTASFPPLLIGLWAVSSDVCQSPEGEGWIRIAANSLTAYELALRPLEVKATRPDRWAIRSEGNYLGTQFAQVIQTLSLDGDALTVQPRGEPSERYLRCHEGDALPKSRTKNTRIGAVEPSAIVEELSRRSHIPTAELRELLSDCAQTQLSMNLCAFRDFVESDLKLDDAVESRLGSLPAECQADVDRTQAAWRIERDNACDEATKPDEGASMRPMLASACKTAATQERMRWVLEVWTCPSRGSAKPPHPRSSDVDERNRRMKPSDQADKE